MVVGLPRIPSRCSAHHDAFGDSECRLHVTHMWQARWGQNTHETTMAFRIIHYPKDLQTLLRRDTVAPPVAIPPWRFHVLEAVSHPADMRTPWWHCHSQQNVGSLTHWDNKCGWRGGTHSSTPARKGVAQENKWSSICIRLLSFCEGNSVEATEASPLELDGWRWVSIL